MKEAPRRIKVRLFLYVCKTQSDNTDDYKHKLKQLTICNHSITPNWRNNLTALAAITYYHLFHDLSSVVEYMLTKLSICATFAVEAPKKEPHGR